MVLYPILLSQPWSTTVPNFMLVSGKAQSGQNLALSCLASTSLHIINHIYKCFPEKLKLKKKLVKILMFLRITEDVSFQHALRLLCKFLRITEDVSFQHALRLLGKVLGNNRGCKLSACPSSFRQVLENNRGCKLSACPLSFR